MDHLLPGGYSLNDPTWFYLSFLLILAVYFKFSRLWSMRNIDLVLLLSISPGLLLVRHSEKSVAAVGYAWLFGVTALLLVRALSDGLITRRPRLEQNMNAAGMVFLCAATFLFLTTKLLTEAPAADTVPVGPATSLVADGVAQISKVVAPASSAASPTDPDVVTGRLIAILAHLAVIVGLALVGRHIFGDPDVGFAMATLYMLLPCTAYDVGKINHVLPAALVVWAIWAYRRPFVSGALLGLACAMMFFPIFLLPLWAVFYGRRGGLRFGTAVALTTAAILSCLMLMSSDSQTVARALLGYVPWNEFLDSASKPGWWEQREAAYLVPVFVSYLVMLVALTVWPRRKSLAHVIPHSAAIIIGMQFWYPDQGGVYVLWYLPILLLVVFRPLMTNHFAPELKPLQLLQQVAGQGPPQAELVGSSAGVHSPTSGERNGT